MNKRVITRLSEAGVDVFRFNLSHIDAKDVPSMMASVRACSEVPICLDTEGAQVRTGRMKGKVLVKEGETIEICSKPVLGSSTMFSLTPEEVVSHLLPGDLISLDFDTALLRVIKKQGNKATVMVLYDGHILSNKGARIVNRHIKLAPFTKKDVAVIQKGMKAGIKHVALSFANSPEDVLALRRLCKPDVFIISKIESHQGLLNLDKILDVSDAILIDRGDLSKEESIVAIPFLQKYVIERANTKKKPVYVATNLLESMINYRSPTRAEVNDVINTLLDGADGLVLAAETAVGSHPIGSVNTIRSLIQQFKHFSNKKHILNSYRNTPSYLLVPPHGGILVDREDIIPGEAKRKLTFKRTIDVDEYVMIDAEQIACGAYSPLEGFMTRAQLMSVLEKNVLPTNDVWTMPIICQVTEKEYKAVKKGDRVGLRFEDNGEVYGYLDVEDVFAIDLEKVTQLWFGTTDLEHPGVAQVCRKGPFCLGGKITVFRRRRYPLSEYVLSPKEVRTIFEHKGWTKVVAFHTRNVAHRAHEHIQLAALRDSFADGLFIHPLIGPKKTNDFTSEAIIKSYELMIKKFYPKGKVFFSAFPAYPRYAGPREAVFTAICRKNYGATHFIVGRDHSGVGGYYKPTAAKEAFSDLKDLGIEIIPFDRVLYCSKCKSYVETCKHDIQSYKDISGSAVREMIIQNRQPMAYLMRPVVSRFLLELSRTNGGIFVKGER